jgi:hypothetical protein
MPALLTAGQHRALAKNLLATAARPGIPLRIVLSRWPVAMR